MNATPTNRRTLYGSIAMLIAFLLSSFNVDVAAADIEAVLGQAVEAVQVLLGVGGFAVTVWQQLRKPKDEPAKEEPAGE